MSLNDSSAPLVEHLYAQIDSDCFTEEALQLGQSGLLLKSCLTLQMPQLAKSDLVLPQASQSRLFKLQPSHHHQDSYCKFKSSR